MAGRVPLHEDGENLWRSFHSLLVACSMKKKGSLGETASFLFPFGAS